MAMPTYERRYYLGMLTREFERKEEAMEEAKEQTTTSGGKGSRTSKVSGQQLKSKMIPKNVIIVDIGINRVFNQEGKNKIVGDVDFNFLILIH